MHLSNEEKWMAYTDALPTPDNMMRWAWIYTIASALERRVWIGPEHEQLFPNIYVVFVSKPGIGKSFVIRYISSMLRRWNRGDNAALINAKFSGQNKVMAEVTTQLDKETAAENQAKSKEKEAEIIKPFLIKMTPDASTYEALVIAFGKAVGRINYIKPDKDGNPGIGLYIHCSLCCILPEFGSLLRKRANDTVTFLLAVYDCPLDYDYETVTRGRDRIRKGCLNLLAATNPSFMQETLDEKLVNEAFVSRIFYVFASKNRKPVCRIPELTETQKQYRTDLENHILKLTSVYGQCTMSEDTWKFIHDWWCDHEEHPEKRASNSPKLDPYYSRLIIHMQKVAMAFHFSEWDGVTMEISLETVKKAITFLRLEEKSMHLALVLESRDKGALMIRKILEFLRDNELNYIELYVKVYQSLGVLDKKVFEEALEFLRETKQIESEGRIDEITGECIAWWRLK